MLREVADIPRSIRTSGRALVTGAASGIGRAFARELARRGEGLLLLDRDEEGLRALIQEITDAYQVPADAIPLDLTDSNAPQIAGDACVSRRVHVSMLINCAGLGARVPFDHQTSRSIREIIDVNVMATVELTRLVLPDMIARREGTIINVSSIAAFERMPNWAIYGASKAFIQSFTESLCEEVQGTGIYVTSVCPGITRTPFLSAAGLEESEVPAGAPTAEAVVAEALLGIDCRKPLIVTGFSNRMRVQAQRASLRGLARSVRRGLRKLRLLA